MPNLLQYVNSGNYYCRIKVGRKLIRESLQSSVWTTAKLRLVDFLKKHQEARVRVPPPKFSEVLELFERDLRVDTNMKPRSKQYRLAGATLHCFTPQCSTCAQVSAIAGAMVVKSVPPAPVSIAVEAIEKLTFDEMLLVTRADENSAYRRQKVVDCSVPCIRPIFPPSRPGTN